MVDRKIKLVVAYDGTDFHGWQLQPRDISVASTLENSYKKIFGESVRVIGASRTDAGVHALGQVAIIKTAMTIPAERIQAAWNGALPNTIHIRSVVDANPIFHPNHDVLQKTYYYHLFYKRPMPMVARYGWVYNFIHQVDFEKFAQCLNFFIGEHDFSAFAKIEGDKNPVRKVDAITIKRYDSFGLLQIQVKGKSFLHYQIRRMIGYALDIARRPAIPADYVQEILKSRNAEQELIQASASGLCLRKICYDKRVL